MADSIKQEFGLETELIKGARGVFDVALDGEQVFSKHSVERFPEPDEVEAALRPLLASQ